MSDVEYDLLGNLNLLFYGETDILNLLFLFDFFAFFQD